MVALVTQLMKSLFAVDGPNAAALNFVVAAIQRFAHLSKLREVAGHGIFNKVLWRAAGGGRKLLEARLGFRLEMHYHRTEFRGPALGCQSDSLPLIGRLVSLGKGTLQAMQEAQSDYRARYYDAITGRFVSSDPVAFAGGQPNFYLYIGNHPNDLTDPFGLRPLKDCEKNKLAPFIPKIDLDNADLHDDHVPWYLGKDYAGITRGNHIYFRPGVYDPCKVAGLATLGHELVHVGQYRNGLTWAKYLWASRHGYDKNPYEPPAYEKEAEIMKGLHDACCGGCSK